jgi:hypothetical protein
MLLDSIRGPPNDEATLIPDVWSYNYKNIQVYFIAMLSLRDFFLLVTNRQEWQELWQWKLGVHMIWSVLQPRLLLKLLPKGDSTIYSVIFRTSHLHYMYIQWNGDYKLSLNASEDGDK